ncbi:ATP-binding protein [Streptomyces triticagri]|uniref:ATP-binding protein n=1 Tax=Streptomyces triticagri TaxID=2293568 RepID=A0A372LYC3_9ACTN|nr:ATP-binding protein [Streptomyces triticagri]RFU83047.1 ATP-binding protein [Streptomyces triticagri]
MDPIHRGPEENGRDSGRTGTPGGAVPAGAGASGGGSTPRPPRDALTPEFGSPVPARTVQLVTGDFLLTVNPVDGSEIEPCPPGEQPPRPQKYTAAQRAEVRSTARPPAPAGPAAPRLPLLERQEERERLVRLLARGRSVRLTGPAGSGRTALLDAVAEDCADLAPDGVIRLNGHRRSATELLHELYAAAYRSQEYRPDHGELLTLVQQIGAVVVLDDLEFGGAALDELLDATPECAVLVATTPDIAAPSPDSHLEEVFLGGLGRSGGLELLERAVGRPLTDDEAGWAADLWFESEGLPLRFVQAGALLRRRDLLRADPTAFDEYGYYAEAPVDAPFDADDMHDVPLPTLAEGAAPAALLAARLSESARTTLRFAVALGGEVPHQAHLPALVGDTHADAALGELVAAALVTPVGARYRLAAGVQAQLETCGYAEDAADRALTAAQHYAWWAGHPSVTPERAAAEADAALAALAVLVPGSAPGHASAAVLLARTAAPAYAAAFAVGAWERTLRAGQEAAREAGEVGEEAYFHHELGILALIVGQLDRARAELEASIGMRGVLADKRGTVAGRRALALVADRSGGAVHGGRTAAGEEVPDARYEESASPPGGVPLAVGVAGVQGEPPEEPSTVIVRSASSSPAGGGRKRVVLGARRNLAAAGAGALLAAVLGTVVTLGATSDDEPPANKVRPGQSAVEDSGDDGLPADQPSKDEATAEAADPTAPVSSEEASTPSESPTDDASSPDPDPTTPDPDPTTPDPDPTTPDPDPTTPDPDPTTPDPDPTTPDPDPTTPDPDPTTAKPPPSTSETSGDGAPASRTASTEASSSAGRA